MGRFETHSSAERKIVEALMEQLKPPYEILSSTKYVYRDQDAGGAMREGEFDALVFHPQKGLLVIEVKGGGIKYDGRIRRWYSQDHRRHWHRIKDPFDQALTASRTIYKSFLKNDIVSGTNVPIPIGHAVFFPDLHWRDDNLPAHASRDVILDSSSLGRLETEIPRIMGLFRSEDDTGLNESEAARVRSLILYPACSVMPTLKSKIEQEEIELLRMTEEQFHLLDFLEETRQIAIKGYAGTGKTLLAMEKARRLYHKGLNVALLCFNRPLADDIAKNLISMSDRILVNNYHVLARDLCSEAEIPFDIPSNELEQFQHFWDEIAPAKMKDAIGKTCRKFDAIIVDEGQDFLPRWWVTIRELLADEKESHFYIFFDPNQKIYRDEIQLPVPVAPLVLKTNCRNTRNIGELVCKLGGIEMNWPPDSAKGESPKFIEYKNDEEQVVKLEACVKRLCEKERLEPGDIVCLSTHSRKNSCLKDAKDLAGIPITEELLIHENKLRFSSLYRFKGLEANVVLLLDVGEDDYSARDNLYVAISRARHRLYVFYQEGWKPPV